MNRIQIEIILGIFLVLLTSVLLILVGLNEEERMVEFARAQDAQAIEIGATLYEANCSGCHATQGEGIAGLCPPLNDAHFFTNRLTEVGWSGSLEDYIVSTVSSGRMTSTRPGEYVGQGNPAMPAWSEQYGGPLREDQVRSIAAFVMNWEATAIEGVTLEELATPTPSVEELEDPVARGRRVYLDNGCGGCHTIEGLSAGNVGPNLTEIGSVAETRIEGVSADDYLVESILFPNAYIVEGYPENVMLQTFGENLTDQQLEDLITFLLAQR
jgi:mono/diheme cytochrome c family protein